MALNLLLQRLRFAQNKMCQSDKNKAKYDEHQRESPIDIKRHWYQHDQRYRCNQVIAKKTQPKPPKRIGALQHNFHQATRVRIALLRQGQL